LRLFCVHRHILAKVFDSNKHGIHISKVYTKVYTLVKWQSK
jgi:hypothetical protein